MSKLIKIELMRCVSERRSSNSAKVRQSSAFHRLNTVRVRQNTVEVHPFFDALVVTVTHQSGLTPKRRAENIGAGTFERFSTNERHLDDTEMSVNAVRLPPLTGSLRR